MGREFPVTGPDAVLSIPALADHRALPYPTVSVSIYHDEAMKVGKLCPVESHRSIMERPDRKEKSDA